LSGFVHFIHSVKKPPGVMTVMLWTSSD
jgi:hypothetical protein